MILIKMKKLRFIKLVCLTLICAFTILLNYSRTEGAEAGENQKQISSNIATISKSPKAKFDNPEFNFIAVEEGKKVVHDFIIKNIGNDILLIKQVKTDCGCTAVNYDREIYPQKEGRIRINLDTTGYADKKITKLVKVHTNDSENSVVELKISGSVDTVVNISPRVVRLLGTVSQQIYNGIQMTVKIRPAEKYPFQIKEIKLYDGTNISVELKSSNLPTGSWDLIVKNIRDRAGYYFDEISIKTDSPVASDIKIKVRGDITD